MKTVQFQTRMMKSRISIVFPYGHHSQVVVLGMAASLVSQTSLVHLGVRGGQKVVKVR